MIDNYSAERRLFGLDMVHVVRLTAGLSKAVGRFIRPAALSYLFGPANVMWREMETEIVFVVM